MPRYYLKVFIFGHINNLIFQINLITMFKMALFMKLFWPPLFAEVVTCFGDHTILPFAQYCTKFSFMHYLRDGPKDIHWKQCIWPEIFTSWKLVYIRRTYEFRWTARRGWGWPQKGVSCGGEDALTTREVDLVRGR